MITTKLSDYAKCLDCGAVHKKSEMLICDGLISRYTTIDLNGRGAVSSGIQTCDRVICKSCAMHIAGYDLCHICKNKRS